MSNIIEITNINSPELNIYTKLSERQLLHYNEPDTGIFICESPKVISRALAAGYTPISFLADHSEIKNETLNIINNYSHIPVYTADDQILTSITGFHLTRGMLCAMKRKCLLSPQEVIQNARRIAILEDIENPTNVGAIFRSAAALNMDAILLTPACSDPLYRRAARVSMGTVFQAPWTILEQGPSDDIDRHYITSIKGLGFKTVAFALRADSISINDPVLSSTDKLAIIVGTEGQGLKDSTLDACDYIVKIPMSHGVDSLNVAAASAVAFWVLGQ